ncbi:hypothetical protein K3N28_05755 [Glycomyces sp. TRM65418]|uniref:hypothetical protein n=1 Tax=Glycomyces sp. TRM65418 TaxID=2867006 RepID=UPI001CE598DF|nr:hypothetical protein [Glycomyces sp. TRM65418]MCC3762573.1 hypothetical protein [Glycomyces sp. TRM65418]QZD56612.1 hypothetical protein K3N28_05715 [Glycomyces sp. TRM65418]
MVNEPVQPMAQVVNLGPPAQMYGSLAAVLAGFAFTALILYLERQDGPGRRKPELGPSAKYAHINAASIVKTLFYAMCALTVCAFLYSRLAGETELSSRVLLGLSLYGMVLGPAVLSLFYALNLVMVTHPTTRSSAEATRWVVAAAGPAVVVGMLADLLDSAWQQGCNGACPQWMSPRWWSFGLLVAFVLGGLLLTVPALQRAQRLRKAIRRLQHRTAVQSAADFLLPRPHLPALITLGLASAIGIGSLWARGIAVGAHEGLDPRIWVHPVLILTATVMAIFAFATGSVLDPAPTKSLGRSMVDGHELEFRAVVRLPRVRVVDVKTGEVLGTVVGLASRRPKLRPWDARGARWIQKNREKEGAGPARVCAAAGELWREYERRR